MIVLDPKNAGPVISPLLFGHNLEHTRRAMWQGLSAELLANRKFAGESVADVGTDGRICRGQGGADGVVARWYAIGWPAAEFVASVEDVFAGAQSQKITVGQAGIVDGVGQGQIPLKAGAAYDVRLWIKSDREVGVAVRICGEDAGTIHVTEATQIAPGDWRPWQFRFTMRRSELAGRFHVTFEGPGTIWLGAASLLPANNFMGLRRS